MPHYTFSLNDVCAALVEFDLDDHIVHNVQFIGGCQGNLNAIGKLVEGRDIYEVIDTLTGICCGNKLTSCADQFAKSLAKTLSISI